MGAAKTRGITKAVIAAGVALALSSAAQAQPQANPAPWQSYCAGLTKENAKDITDFERDQITLPKDWRPFAAISKEWLAVRTKSGAVQCVDLVWIGEMSGFETFGDRFAGFEWEGFEAFGYVLVDRAGTGTVIETGKRPEFSPDGYMMAALEHSESDWGALSGFGVWTVLDSGLQAQYLTKKLPSPTTDWRIDRWEGSHCIHISAIPFDRIGDNGDNLEQVKRDHYVSGFVNGWELQPGTTCPTYEN